MRQDFRFLSFQENKIVASLNQSFGQAKLIIFFGFIPIFARPSFSTLQNVNFGEHIIDLS